VNNNHFMLGQRVRILKYRDGRLGRTPATYWSKRVYSIVRRDGYKWRVAGADGAELKRRLRQSELQVVRMGEREDDAGEAEVEEQAGVERRRRRVRQRERIEPDQAELEPGEAPDTLPAGLEGKTLWEVPGLKAGAWLFVYAQGMPEEPALLRFTKGGAQCTVWGGRVSSLDKRKKLIRMRYLVGGDAPRTRTLASRALTLQSGLEALEGSTGADMLLYIGPVDFPAEGKGALPRGVVDAVKARYEAGA
jgi:hypothetical protein